jgi:endonuclease/exonuclease/phosphatase family metal-dependent hydrolase
MNPYSNVLRLGAALFAGSLLVACASPDAEAPADVPAVSIMTFNVENLFDNIDDPGKNDYTFLALADKQTDEHRAVCTQIQVERWRDQCLFWDWSDELIEKKLEVVAAAILQVDDGRGADIVALQEVENIRILERLRTEYLAAAGYAPAILIEGKDLRGIDVAYLTRLPLVGEPALHAITFEGIEEGRVRDTRGILQADFALPDGSVLTGFAVHFPAPFHPTAMREVAYGRLNELRASLPDEHYVFAAGDFNTTSLEDREKAMLERFARPYWTVAHEVGCEKCEGTSYYAPRDDWSFLDMILWSPAAVRRENATWQLRADSVRIANGAPGQRRPDGTPWRFEAPQGDGVSDHWPVVAIIEFK